MKSIARIVAVLLGACLSMGQAYAQFTPGQILTAAQLNSAFSAKLSLTGGALSGPLTAPSLSVTGTATLPSVAITGGTITGLSAPVPVASGGTGAATQSAALTGLLGSSAVPIANGGTGATTATGATSQLQYLQGATGSIARTLTGKFQESVSATDFMTSAQISDTQTGSPTLDAGPSINSAINSVAAHGGGVVRLPAGIYGDSTTIVEKTGVTLKGDGKGATTIRALASSTVPVIQTYQFASLTGTNTVGGPYHWGITDLSIDGNKSSRGAITVDNLDIYGYDYILNDVESFNSPGTDIYSEWAISGTVPVASGGNSMEAHIHNVKTMYAGVYGLVFNGPHDSVIDGFETYENSGGGALFGNTTNYTGGATYLTNFHSYSNWSNWGLIVYCQLYVSNVQSEGNTGGGIQVNTGSGVLVGQNVVTWGNIGPGLWLNGAQSLLSSVTSHNNTSGTGDGISITQPGQSLANVTSFLNTGNGITGSSAAASSSITNVNNYSNTGAGISWAGAASTLANLVLAGNAGGGLVAANGLSGSIISGSLANNTGVQAAFGTLGASNLIDLNFYTGSGETAWSGTLSASNQIRLNATGNDTRQLTVGLGTMPLYGATGTVAAGPHMVTGSTALVAGTATVTLSGSAVFSSSTSYVCTANDATAAAAVKVGQTSGTSITLTGTSTDTVQFSCFGT